MINNRFPDKTALVTKDQSVSYRLLIRNIQAYAHLIKGKGFQKIAIFSENRPEWIYAFYAAWQNDAIVVPVDFLSSVEDGAYILNDCRPELVFASSGVKQTWDQITGKLHYHPMKKPPFSFLRRGPQAARKGSCFLLPTCWPISGL
ncbi:MAG: AMP-binding protein [Bacteroidales bacterium]|nr:AMP-binding protein [Bacteroidales bacterium]